MPPIEHFLPERRVAARREVDRMKLGDKRREPEPGWPNARDFLTDEPRLRDHFAMAALGAMSVPYIVRDDAAQGVAEGAYRIADAMMKARKFT